MAPRKSARLRLQESRQRDALAFQASNQREEDIPNVESDINPPIPPTTTVTSPPPPSPPMSSTSLVPGSEPNTSPPAAPPINNLTGASTTKAAGANEAAPQPVVLSIRCRNPDDGGMADHRRWVQSFKSRQLGKTFPGGKIPVDWSEFHQGPLSAKLNSLIAHDIGCAIRAHVPMSAPSYTLLTDDDRKQLTDYLMNLYEISPDDVRLWGYIDNKAYTIFKEWKYECRKHWKKHGDAVPFEFLHRPTEWTYLLDVEFKPAKKQAISAQNQSNRTKNPEPMNHCCGSKPIIYIAGEYLKDGHPAPLCAAAVYAYDNCKNGNEKVQSLKRAIEEIQEQQNEDLERATPISMDKQVQILDDIYGVQKGTNVRGAGRVIRRPPKQRGGPRYNLDVQEARERATNAEERAKNTEDRATQALERNKLLEERLASMEKMMQNFWNSQNVFAQNGNAIDGNAQMNADDGNAQNPNVASST